MDTSKHRLERILCEVTFSRSARRVVAWAASLAASNDAEVRLFHALPNSEDLASAMAEADSERVLKKLFALAHRCQDARGSAQPSQRVKWLAKSCVTLAW